MTEVKCVLTAAPTPPIAMTGCSTPSREAVAAIARAAPPTTMALGSTPGQLLAQAASSPAVSTQKNVFPEYLVESVFLILIDHLPLKP